jgi:hypothetical protein
MPAKKQPGIGRINIRCESWFADRVAVAAEQTGRSLSSYVRIALIAQMKKDGVSTAAPADVPEEEVVRPVGRPRSVEEPAVKTRSRGKSKRPSTKKKEG